MGRINVMMRMSQDGKVARGNVFGISGIWGKTAVTDKFYGTVAILSEFMAAHGALPGIVAMCPIVVPVNGSWMLRKVVEKVVDSADDIEATVFADEGTYQGILDCDRINDVWVIETASAEQVFTYRGWDRGETETCGIHRIVHMTRKNTLDISDDDMNAEIERMETEMCDEPLTEEESAVLDHIYDVISGGWKVFDRYGRDMPEFLKNTTPDSTGGDLVSEDIDGDYDGCLEDGPETQGMREDYRKMLEDEALDAPAPLRTVRLLSNTLTMLSDTVVKEIDNRKKALDDIARKFSVLDERATGVIRDYEEAGAVTREAVREEIDGLRRQLGLVIAERRAENLAFKVCASVCAVSMIAHALMFFLA